jgi:hypothetical protein
LRFNFILQSTDSDVSHKILFELAEVRSIYEKVSRIFPDFAILFFCAWNFPDYRLQGRSLQWHVP